MMPSLQIGPIALPMAPLIIIVGIWLGLSLAERSANQHKLSADQLFNLALIAMITGVIAGRLVFVARHSSAFSQNWLDVFSRNLSLFDPLGGLAAGILAGSIYAQRKNLPLWLTLDCLAPAFAVLAVAIHLANLASGIGFGTPTSLPWGIQLWGVVRHPVQFYEALAAGIILWLTRHNIMAMRSYAPGITFAAFFALTAAARLFFEAFHGDSLVFAGGFRTVQVIAWIVLAASLWLLRKHSFSPERDRT